MSKVFLLIPTLQDVGPIKGAVAIANGLCKYFDVTLVVLKNIYSHKVFIRDEVEILTLGKSKVWISKYLIYKKILKERCDNKKPISISMCFSADIINLLVKNDATVISSVRASIPITYLSTYGGFGTILAKCHIYILKKFEHVISMSESMSKQLYNSKVRGLIEVGNFVDEENLNKEKIILNNTNINYPRFVFVGSFIKRKRVDLLIDAVYKLKIDGIQIEMDLIGDGPLKEVLYDRVNALGIKDQIIFHGHQANPYSILQRADYFVLPSMAEGVPRAALEALYFGVPCVLRDIDANNELIITGKNGYLFTRDEEFFDLLREISTSENKRTERKSLIPPSFQYETCIGKLVQLVNSSL
jgi:glycosyltransferase involved in cell wall biosynthesis